MGVIARSALRITCQRDNPGRKTIWPCPDLSDRHRRRAAHRLGCHQSVPPSPCAERDPQALHLADRPGASGRCPAACLSADHRVPGGSRDPFRTGPGTGRCSQAPEDARKGAATGAQRPVSQSARLTRSASEYGARRAPPVWPG